MFIRLTNALLALRFSDFNNQFLRFLLSGNLFQFIRGTLRNPTRKTGVFVAKTFMNTVFDILGWSVIF